MAEKLKLLAQDADDLVLISAALQDAEVKLADISYAPATRTVTFPLTRYRWEADGKEQVSCAVQFGGCGELKVEVECVDAALADLSDPWPVDTHPDHGVEALDA